MTETKTSKKNAQQSKSWWLAFVPFLCFVLLAAVFFLSIGRNPTLEANGMIGQEFPDFTLRSLVIDGQAQQNALNKVSRDAILAQVPARPWLLNVWASWCPQCYAEHGFIAALAANGASVIGLNYKDTTEKANGFLAKMGNPYTLILADTAGELGFNLGVSGAPETYLIDSSGIIVVRHAGVIDRRVWDQKFAQVWEQDAGSPLFEGD